MNHEEAMNALIAELISLGADLQAARASADLISASRGVKLCSELRSAMVDDFIALGQNSAEAREWANTAAADACVGG
jgi:hypothetical protein